MKSETSVKKLVKLNSKLFSKFKFMTPPPPEIYPWTPG